MLINAYLILEPGADRPYFCHQFPTSYTPEPGAKVFSFTLDVPGFEKKNGVIQLEVKDVRELPPGATTRLF
jgi:hypothetical protein